jgi:hypothetical protein
MKSRCALVLVVMSAVVLSFTPTASLNSLYQGQARVASVGIIDFGDESGTGASAEALRRISLDLRRKITGGYKDIVPRSLSPETGSGAAMTIEQLVGYGKQNGVGFVVRGAILTVSIENQSVLVELYADVITIGTGEVSSMRSEGTAGGAGPTIDWRSVRAGAGSTQATPLEQAISMAAEKLASSLHQAINSPPAAAAQTEIEAPPSEATPTSSPVQQSSMNEDDELQQMIAQAESLISGETAGNDQSFEALKQALSSLKAGLESKAGLMEQAGDTSQADREISAGKEGLRAALSALTEQAASSDASAAESQPSSTEKKSVLAKISEYSGEALNILQKIQEMRSLFRSNRDDQQSLVISEGEAGAPVNESTGDVGGVIVEDGVPVEGATVTDSVSGTSSITESDGSYNLTGLVAGRLANLVVTRSGKRIASTRVDLPKERAAVADFDLKSSSSKGTISRILPATVVLKKPASGNSGVVKGRVRDPQGRPVPFAVVNLSRIGVARADSSGGYTFLNVPAGTHQLTARKSGLSLTSQRVQVTAKRSSEAQLNLSTRQGVPRPTPRESIVVSSAGASVRGIVRDAQNRPVTGAKVIAMLPPNAVSVVVGREGSYELRNLRPGQYRMLVSRIGYETGSQSLVLRAGDSLNRDLRIERSSDPVARLVERSAMERPRPPAVPARAREAALGHLVGRIVDQTGLPVAGARVSVAGYPSCQTDSNGNYRVRSLSIGRHRMIVIKRGFSDLNRVVVIRSAEVTRSDLTLVKSQ